MSEDVFCLDLILINFFFCICRYTFDSSDEEKSPRKLRARRNLNTPSKKSSSTPKTIKVSSNEETSPRKIKSRRNLNTPSKKSSSTRKTVKDSSDEETSPRKTVARRNLNTPSRKSCSTPKTVKVSNLRAEVGSRATALPAGQSKLEEACLALRKAPKCVGGLPCREQEFEDVLGWVRGCLEDRTGGCMYISGVPGTGKTATVREVMNTLACEQPKGSFKYIDVNALALSEPRQIYVEVGFYFWYLNF